MEPPVLSIGGVAYEHVVTRNISIYRGDDAYLRIGAAGDVRSEHAIHKRLLESGFPVAELLSEGEHRGLGWYTEASLGHDTLGDIFDAETSEGGTIADGTFGSFLSVILAWGRAQLSAASDTDFADDFRRMCLIEEAVVAYPDLAGDIQSAFGIAVSRLRAFPAVPTHGDFHAFNACAGGVIDLDRVGWGPAGYDLIAALLIPELFPHEEGAYVFTEGHRVRYLSAVDELFASRGLPAPSAYTDDYLVCKLGWSAAWRQRTELREWMDTRYREMLAAYLGEGIVRITP